MARLRSNDIVTPVYTAVETVDGEGMIAKAWVKGVDVQADWQPTGTRNSLQVYGLDTIPSDSWIVYHDTMIEYPRNCVAIKDGANYQSMGSKPWYSHVETIFIPWAGSLT